jgi:hypothetical protein
MRFSRKFLSENHDLDYRFILILVDWFINEIYGFFSYVSLFERFFSDQGITLCFFLLTN